MSNHQDTELQCDICFNQYDLKSHRPKVLFCGHTLCKECVLKPALGRKCPTCRKDIVADPRSLPDNNLAIRIIERDNGANPGKRRRLEDPKSQQLQQLQRGVDAGKNLAQRLIKVFPETTKVLTRQRNTSIEHLRKMEEALANYEQEGAEDPTPKQMQLVAQLEDSVRLLTSSKCSVTVAEQGGASWKAAVEFGELDQMFRLSLLQLRASGQLQKVDAVVKPPTLSILSIETFDLDESGNLRVDEILNNGPRWRNVRTLRKLRGQKTEKLLRVLAPHLEELEISDVASVSQLEEVRKMKSLKRLLVICRQDCDDYPDLPSQLEELSIWFPSERQLRCVQTMASLRSLYMDFYYGNTVSFHPPLLGGLLWLGVNLNVPQKDTILSLIRASAPSLLELRIEADYKSVDSDNHFPDLGPFLAACGLRALRRIVLKRTSFDDESLCLEVGDCLLQRRTVQGFLPSVEVVCDKCH